MQREAVPFRVKNSGSRTIEVAAVFILRKDSRWLLDGAPAYAKLFTRLDNHTSIG